MDFTLELLGFQGAIVSADNIHSFSQLSAKGGNEQKVKFVVDSLSNYLNDKYFTKDVLKQEAIPIMRQFAFYIILNTELPILEEMVAMEAIETVIWTIPTVPKHLMSELLWNLNMESFIYEIVVYCWPQLALEVADGIINNMKYLLPAECIYKLKSLAASLYRLMCKLQSFTFENDTLSKNLSLAFNNLEKCLKYFITPPNAYKLQTLNRTEQYKHQGKCLLALLKLLYECLDQFTGTQQIDNNLYSLYSITYKKQPCSLDYKPCEITNKLIMDHLHMCHTVMLETSKELIMDVSVDVFCSWSEFEENNKTMQETIGELCYRLREKLLIIPSTSEHPLVDMIQQISHKPVEIIDIINATDSQKIIENINNNNKEKELWIHALLERDQLCLDTNLLNVIASNLDVLNEDECYKLYKLLLGHLNNNSVNKDYIEILSMKVFNQCNIKTKYEILDEQFDKNIFINKTECSDFCNVMTEIFNKLIMIDDADITAVLSLFLQNPENVYVKICNLASENIQQMNIVLKVMKLLEKYSNHYYESDAESCLIKVIKEIYSHKLNTEAKQNNFIRFISELKNSSIILGSELLLLIIMPNMHKALLSKNISAINTQIKTLREAFSSDDLLEYRAPILAMLAQVLTVVRWRIVTYEALAPTTLHITLELQQSLLITYNYTIPDNESKWLKSKIGKLDPLNMYYYRILWNPPGSTFVSVITGMNIDKNTKPESLISSLSQVVCSTTQQEWYDIWDSLVVFSKTTILNIFHTIMLIITSTEEKHRTDASWQCLLYCYRNLILIIRYKYLDEPLEDKKLSLVIDKVASMINIMKEDKMEEIASVFLPLLAYIVEKRTDYTIDIFKTLKSQVKHKSFIDAVSKIFVTESG